MIAIGKETAQALPLNKSQHDHNTPGVVINSHSGQQPRPRPKTKKRRILEALIGGEYLNFIRAQQRHGDRTLHSTVSELRQDGVPIKDAADVVPGYRGEPTHCKIYWVAREDLEQAGRVLERLR